MLWLFLTAATSTTSHRVSTIAAFGPLPQRRAARDDTATFVKGQSSRTLRVRAGTRRRRTGKYLPARAARLLTQSIDVLSLAG